jgi:hypothetical protein
MRILRIGCDRHSPACGPSHCPRSTVHLETLPRLVDCVGRAAFVLLHGDPHARNVLCRVAAAEVRCGGIIDLEAAAGGPRELDLAHALVLHGQLFNQPLPHGWFDELRAGYRLPLDDYAIDWFALYHLLNLGFFSALVGDHAHAENVARAAQNRAECLRGRCSGTAPALLASRRIPEGKSFDTGPLPRHR